MADLRPFDQDPLSDPEAARASGARVFLAFAAVAGLGWLTWSLVG
jgi:hypothetical protein